MSGAEGERWSVLRTTRTSIGHLDFRSDTVEAPDGTVGEWSYLDHPGCVVVVAVWSGHLLLLRHFRPAVRKWCWEIPAGRLDRDQSETPADAARRELREETGAVALRLEPVTEFWASTGSSNERCHVFYAVCEEIGPSELEVGETLTCHRVPIAQALEMARTGKIDDGPSALALLLCEARLTAATAGAR